MLTNYEKLKELEEKLRDVSYWNEVKKELEKLNKVARGMTEDRIKTLDAVHFIWDVPTYVWELQFEKLHLL
jgi:hypothetical protein